MTAPSVPFHAPRTLRVSGGVTFEGPDRVRKHGTRRRLQREVEAMEYVRHRTSIPIPAILEVHSGTEHEDSRGWMLMERLPGLELGVAWPEMSGDARAEIMKQLRSYLEQLHQLRPEDGGRIGSCSGGPAHDHRLDNRSTRGPFPTVSDFHDSLFAPVKNCPRPEWAAKYRDQLSDSYDIHFAHADLSWENILVDPETGDAKGILRLGNGGLLAGLVGVQEGAVWFSEPAMVG